MINVYLFDLNGICITPNIYNLKKLLNDSFLFQQQVIVGLNFDVNNINIGDYCVILDSKSVSVTICIVCFTTVELQFHYPIDIGSIINDLIVLYGQLDDKVNLYLTNKYSLLSNTTTVKETINNTNKVLFSLAKFNKNITLY